eukprot:2876985-Pleurochrysis_carterae.AAC.3
MERHVEVEWIDTRVESLGWRVREGDHVGKWNAGEPAQGGGCVLLRRLLGRFTLSTGRGAFETRSFASRTSACLC